MDAGFSAVVDPLQLAKQGKRLNGQLALQALPRLAVLSCNSAVGKVEVDLQFSRGEDQQNRVTGSAGASFDVICQRCLGQMSLQLDSEINILLLGSQEEGVENNDGIVCKGKMPVTDLIEDELLLAMPMFPKHRAGDCKIKREQVKSAANGTGSGSGSDKGQKTSREDNPFAVLAKLKSGQKSQNQKKDSRSGKKAGKK